MQLIAWLKVENEALALLEQDSSGNRRYTFAELMMRAKGIHAIDPCNLIVTDSRQPRT